MNFRLQLFVCALGVSAFLSFESAAQQRTTQSLKQPVPLPVSVAREKWQQVKVVTYGEIRPDLLTEIKDCGYFFGEMGSGSTAPISVHGGLGLFAASVRASVRLLLSR